MRHNPLRDEPTLWGIALVKRLKLVGFIIVAIGARLARLLEK